MKTSLLFLFVLITATAYSQNTLNKYKYVLVPAKFNFLKVENQYGLNTLAKSLLQEKGFAAFISNEELPQEMLTNQCNVLITELVENNTLFLTKLTLLLKDCQGNIIFKSKEGKSREKEFQAGYVEALKDAFSSLKDVPYQYDGTTSSQPQQPQQPKQPAVTPAASSSMPSPAPASPSPVMTDTTGILYAQATSNGYQLIDTTPKKVLTLFKTTQQDHFIAEAGTSNGIVFRKNEEWFFEYYKDNKLVSQKLLIKF